MLSVKISPSVMCADFLNISNDIKELEMSKIEYLHMDVMDGVFVPNITLSNDIMKQLRKITDIPFDFHFMITSPTKKLDWFDIKENDLVSFHIEAEDEVEEGIDKIHQLGAKAGLAISPNTPVEKLYKYLDKIDFCLVMTVQPGFAGQKLIPETLKKIKELRQYLDENNYEDIMIEVDGNVSFDNSLKMRECGADIFVGGTSSIFSKSMPIIDNVREFRKNMKAMNQRKKVFVIGSINTDYVISVDQFPEIGESRNGYGFFINQGGKGANQAIACKKLGCEDVYLISAVGNDERGESLINQISSFEINTDLIMKKEDVSTGTCMIVLDDSKKDNVLIIDRGANDKITASDFAECLRKYARQGDILITQLEICLDAVYEALEIAKEIGMYVILNPAPFIKFDYSYLKYVDLVIPNETETKQFTGITVQTENDAKHAYQWFSSNGVNEVIITLGGKGSVYMSEDNTVYSEAFKTNVVDTTSAGDTFIGALAYQLAEGKQIEESLKYASFASSITISRKGAGISIPTREELEEKLGLL